MIVKSLVLKSTDTFDFNDVFGEFYREYRSEIREYVSLVIPDINLDAYEGGIDSWFGYGSVMCWELGFELTLKHSDRGVILTIK